MASSTYLSRTPSSTTNQKTFTISVWIKKSSPVTNEWIIRATNSSGDAGGLYFNPTGNLFCNFEISGSNIVNLKTNRLFRDTNAWYHIILACDTTQGTASDRVKIYINGVQETSFGTTLYPDQNDDLVINRNVPHFIGTDSTGGANIEAVMSHFNFCDGLALAPTVFGSTDSTTGEWKINTSPSFTLGTNGFTILKDGNTITDQSSNSNNWSLSAGTLTKTEDCPSNVFATLNPLIINNFTLPNMTYVATTEGNNTLTGTGSSNNGNCYATLGASSGKFYCEVKITVNQTNYPYLGIMPEEGLSPTSSSIYGLVGYQFSDTVSYEPNGNKRINGSTSSYGDTYGLNDIIGIAMDLDNGAVYFSKNGTFQNSGNPASGASKTGAALTFTANNKNYFFGGSTFNAGQIKFNFGNGYFGTTAVSSAGTNASGIGIFEYDVPSGYTALSTKGLNL